MYKYILKIFLFIITVSCLFSQKQGNIWYFGDGAGLDFNGGSPVPLFDGKLITEEGCATISDEDGKLLFYTDGVTIWNSKHNPMPNGTGLLGHSSSTQSGVIVPKPGDPNIYYVFTVSDKSRSDGFRYSLVDMRLDGGLGDVTLKNVMLCDSTVEKISAVVHENGFYVWVLMHEWNNDLFRAYLITPSGIQGVETTNDKFPVISRTGSVHSGNVYRKIGYLKASPDGSKLALAKYGEAVVEMFTFNNKSGEINSLLSLSGTKYANAYGIEFSNDGGKLFVSCMSRPSRILVYDVSSDDSVAIVNSEYVLSSVDLDYFYGALQIASDKKIYCVYYEQPFVHVIENPTEKDSKKIRISQRKVNLGDRKAMWGLPTFIQSFFSFRIRILSNMPLCQGDTLHMKTGHADEATYQWTGPNGFRSTKSEVFIPNAGDSVTGLYKLTTTIADVEFRDSVMITVNPKPKAMIGPDRTICIGEAAVIDPVISGGSGDYEIHWSPSQGLSDPKKAKVTATPAVTTDYILTVNDLNGCTCYDTIRINVNIPPLVKAGRDISVCRGDFAGIGDTIISENELVFIEWKIKNDSVIGNTMQLVVIPEKTTEYILTAVDINGCTESDTIKVTVNPVPDIELGDDILICDNQGKRIGSEAKSGTPPYNYSWFPGQGLSSDVTARPNAMPAISTKYYLKAGDKNGCFDIDSITVYIDSVLKSKVFIECSVNSAQINKTVSVPLKLEAPVYFLKAGITGFEAILRFNATVIKPVDFPFEFIKIEDGMQYIRIKGIIDSADVSNGLLMNMNFFTAYGNSTYTDIEITDFSWTYDKCMPITTTGDGCLDIYDICIDFTVQFNNPGLIEFGGIFPNPAKEEINIKMNSSQNTAVAVSVYDLRGRLVNQAGSKYYPLGTNIITIPVNDISTGIYTVHLDTNFGLFIRSLVITR